MIFIQQHAVTLFVRRVSERLIPLIVDETLNEVIEPKWSLVTFLPVVSSRCSPVSASLCVQLSEVDDHLQKAL